MTWAITGSSGLVGSALAADLARDGTPVRRVLRGPAEAPDLSWDPAAGWIDAEGLAGVDVVVNLAGENIGDGRWTDERKERIRASRVEGTKLLAKTLAELPAEARPSVLVNASAVGFYGHRGEEEIDESSPPGDGFLSEVCQAWEAATAAAEDAGVRVVLLRIGAVLDAHQGALAKMLPPFRLGVGGPQGKGTQFMPWIAIDDLVRVIRFVAANDTISGPVDAVAPEPTRNADFAKTLGHVLGRPTFLKTPALAMYALFGKELVDQLLLGGADARPKKLIDAGFIYTHATLEGALRHLLAK
jgi:uncharacterized protein (TIGR01777 family)